MAQKQQVRTVVANLPALTQEIQTALAEIEAHVQQALTSRQNEDWDQTGLQLHAFYTRAESLLRSMAEQIDGSAPQAEGWQRALLKQLSEKVEGQRTFVIKTATQRCLDEYRDFRDFEEVVAGFSGRKYRIGTLIDTLEDCSQALKENVLFFLNLLEEA